MLVLPLSQYTFIAGSSAGALTCPAAFSVNDPSLSLLVGDTTEPAEKVVAISSPLLYHVRPQDSFQLFFYDGGSGGEACTKGGLQRVLVLCKPDDAVRGARVVCGVASVTHQRGTALVPGLPEWNDTEVVAALEEGGPYSSPAFRGRRSPSPAALAPAPRQLESTCVSGAVRFHHVAFHRRLASNGAMKHSFLWQSTLLASAGVAALLCVLA